MTRILLLSVLTFFVLGVPLRAQQNAKSDSINTATDNTLITEGKDTVLLKSYATRYDPRKALLYAAILPGLGQAYNKKYWKIPLVYGGMYALGYAINFYQIGYTKFKLDLFSVIGTGSLGKTGYDETQLRNIVNIYRRQRDFYLILMGLMYVLQIVDAHVDAHLKEFDLNPNLQVRFEPLIENNPMLGRQAGISMTLRF